MDDDGRRVRKTRGLRAGSRAEIVARNRLATACRHGVPSVRGRVFFANRVLIAQAARRSSSNQDGLRGIGPEPISSSRSTGNTEAGSSNGRYRQNRGTRVSRSVFTSGSPCSARQRARGRGAILHGQSRVKAGGRRSRPPKWTERRGKTGCFHRQLQERGLHEKECCQL